MKPAFPWSAARRLQVAGLVTALILAPAAARAELSCRTLGWLNAVVEATAPVAGAEAARQQADRIGTLYTHVDLDLLGSVLFRKTSPGIARDVLDFVRTAKTMPEASVDAWRSPVFVTKRAKAASDLRRLPCGESGSPADRAAEGQIFDARQQSSFFERVSARLGTTGFEPQEIATFTGVILGSFGLLALTLSRTGRNQRRAKRFPCYLDAVVELEDGRYDVTVIDLSQGGCRFVQDDPPQMGCRGAIRIGRTERRVKVVWTAAGMAGVQFDRDLSEKALHAILSGRPDVPAAARMAMLR